MGCCVLVYGVGPNGKCHTPKQGPQGEYDALECLEIRVSGFGSVAAR